MSVSLTDEQLLHQVKKGNNDAFEKLYNKWKKPLYLYLLNLLNYSKDDAEQVLSEVFLSFYEYNKKQEIRNCKTFLYTTAHNKALDCIKKKSELYPKEMQEKVDEQDIAHKEKLSFTYEQGILAKYLSILPTKEHEVVYLYYYEEKSYDEIADIVGSNKNTVGTLLLQAKKKIYELAQREGTLDLFTQ